MAESRARRVMDTALRQRVRDRADHRCEDCRLRQEHQPVCQFHIEHIIPRQHGGGDEEENLALACFHCNLHKGTNLTGVDPDSGEIVGLFHPRRDRWRAHFGWHGLLPAPPPNLVGAALRAGDETPDAKRFPRQIAPFLLRFRQ